MSRRGRAAHAVRTCLSQVAKAIGHEHRLALLEHLGQGERSVEALTALTGLSVANASQHLQQLKRAGLLASRRDGKHVIYRVADEIDVVPLLSSLRRVAEGALPGMERIQTTYFRARDSLEAVSRGDLIERLRRGGVTLLDVRPSEEFAHGHLPAAINIPFDELERRLAELPPNQEIVAYCRGPYCVLSFEAVAALRKRGYTIRRLEDGYPEWRSAGLPVEGLRAAA